MKQKKGRIFHLEDDQFWVEIVDEILGDEYEVVATDMRLSAAEEFYEYKQQYGGTPFDLAIVDINIKKEDRYGNQLDDEKGGFDFISDLIQSNVLPGNRILILSANTHIDDNWYEAGKFKVVERFDKGKFDNNETKRFKRLVDQIVANARATT